MFAPSYITLKELELKQDMEERAAVICGRFKVPVVVTTQFQGKAG